ncbi:hypothetical protein Tco_0364779 [Tanacetum coccineum]
MLLLTANARRFSKDRIFENYVKANDAILKNMQNQGQGSLPSNTVTNPNEDLKGITTRSVENQNPVSEPVNAPVSAPMPNPKPFNILNLQAK